MARYIKANPKVAKFLNLESDRNTVKDGNYLLWQNDMLAFGPLTQLADTLKQIGGIALLAHEAREEQDGTVTRPLPQATDERFIVEAAPTPAESESEVMPSTVQVGESEEAGQTDTDGGNIEQPADTETAEPTGENGESEEKESETTKAD